VYIINNDISDCSNGQLSGAPQNTGPQAIACPVCVCVCVCVCESEECVCVRLRVKCARLRVKCACVRVCSDLSVDCVQDSGRQSGDGGDSRRSRQ